MNQLDSFRPWSHVVGEVSFWYVKSKKVPLLPSSKFLQDGLAEAGMWPKIFLFASQLKAFKFLLKFDWSLKFPHHHIRIRWGPCLRKKGGVCHLPIKFYEHHLSFSTASVTYWHVFIYVNVSLTKKYILNVTAIAIDYARTYGNFKKISWFAFRRYHLFLLFWTSSLFALLADVCLLY